ncbi:hypothetical protein OROMI_009799 [Orobanche minor]
MLNFRIQIKLLPDFPVHNHSYKYTLWGSFHCEVGSSVVLSLAVAYISGLLLDILLNLDDLSPSTSRDIKSTNIILDNNFEAQVVDFGLAKLSLKLDIQTTRVMGTFGLIRKKEPKKKFARPIATIPIPDKYVTSLTKKIRDQIAKEMKEQVETKVQDNIKMMISKVA